MTVPVSTKKRRVRVVIEITVDSSMTTSELEAAVWHDGEVQLNGLEGFNNEGVVSVEEIKDA